MVNDMPDPGFDEAGDVPSYEPPADGEDSVYRETTRVMSSDLGGDGTVLIDVPVSMYTEFYVTTQGVGRFWLEPTTPEGDTLNTRGEANAAASVYGLQDYWTLWTAAKTT